MFPFLKRLILCQVKGEPTSVHIDRFDAMFVETTSVRDSLIGKTTHQELPQEELVLEAGDVSAMCLGCSIDLPFYV